MRLSKTKTLIFAVALSNAVTGCKIAVTPLSKNVSLPSRFDSTTAVMEDTLKPWTIFFADTCLKKLIGEALENNFDRLLALQRIHLAQASLQSSKSTLVPEVGAQLGGTVDKFGDYTMNQIGNDDTNRSETLPDSKHLPTPYTEFLAGLKFAWEINLWGRFSAGRQAYKERLIASRYGHHLVDSRIVSEVALVYFQLLGLDREKEVIEDGIRLRELALELAKVQKEGGRINQVAVDQFEIQVLNARGQLVKVNQQILQAEARCNQLAGRYPRSIQRLSLRDYPDTIAFASTSPLLLLTARPDIKQAEHELLAHEWDLKVARAAFYPSIDLSGVVGVAAFDLSKFALLPASTMYHAAAGLSAPILQRRRIKASFSTMQARRQMALINYRKAVLNAYYEVYIVTRNQEALQDQVRLKRQETVAQRRAVLNAGDLFTGGYATYLEVLTLQRQLLESELQLSNLQAKFLANKTNMYRSLGGGWAQ
jgi:HAE1 family hydrophobic/amphiphilic exporter-1